MPKIIAKKQDWINLGYKLFSEKGIAGIIVEKMAENLKVNKSSFYWHFKSKKEFVNELIKFWIITETEHIIRETEKAKTPKKKLDLFLKIAFKNDPYLEFVFFLKRYAIKSKDIQSIIDEVDNKRLLFTSKLFIDIGYSKKQAEIKSSIFYKYLIGYHEMIKHKKQDKNYLKEVKIEMQHFLKF
jgi:AcrR family transcriptional regulator